MSGWYEDGSQEQYDSAKLIERIATAEARVAELETQVAALQWTPITPDNLPKVEDEVRGENHKVLEVEEWHIGFFAGDARVWLQSGYSHRRPIAAPSDEGETK